MTILDTAGLRETGDVVEAIGIERALSRARAADLRVVLTDGPLPVGVDLGADDLVLRPKADRTAGEGPAISGLTGEGVPALLAHLTAVLARRAAGAGVAVQERHRLALRDAVGALESALSGLDDGSGRLELPAEDLRRAVQRLDALVGRVDVEQVLDRIFSSFCIGK